MGSNVLVTKIDPTKSLEVVMDGFLEVSIDRLTMEQEHYLASWSEGT